MSDFLLGVRYFFSGYGLIWQTHVRSYVFLPLLINILLFGLAIFLATAQLQGMLLALSGWWLWLEWLLWPLFVLMILAVVFFTFSILANLIAAPFNGLLAAAVEQQLKGIKPTGPNRPMMKEVMVTLVNEVGKLVYFALRAIPLLILLFIPGMQILWVLFGGWMLAMEYLDFPMANHGFSFKQVRKTIAHRKLLALGFGLSVMFMALIPVVNFLVMPVAVCGATHLWLKEFDQHNYLSEN